MFKFSKSKDDEEKNDRIYLLEQQNLTLMQEIRNMQSYYNSLFQKYNSHIDSLERRITDFTDIWHPIMTDNMVRIKNEIVIDTKLYIDSSLTKAVDSLTVKDASTVKDALTVKDLSTVKDASTVKDLSTVKDALSGSVLIGYGYNLEPRSGRNLIYESAKPIFINRNCDYETVIKNMKFCDKHFIVDSVKELTKINKINLTDFVVTEKNGYTNVNTLRYAGPFTFVDIMENTICQTPFRDDKFSYGIENLHQAFAECGVELLVDGKTIIQTK
jgi:hypothetical protein